MLARRGRAGILDAADLKSVNEHIVALLRVRVNDSSPVLFGLESGFEQSAITAKQAKALNLKVYGEAQVAGGGEDTQEFSLTRDISFELSGMKVNFKEVGVLSLDFPSPMPNETISGILGYDFINRFWFPGGSGKLVPPARFQRATSRLGGERSMQLSYGSISEPTGFQMCW